MQRMPAAYNRYAEPFVGGGALYFKLHSLGLMNGKHAILIDGNKDTAICYMAIKTNPGGVLQEIRNLLARYPFNKHPGDHITEGNYYKVREFDRDSGWNPSPEERAARYIYLNKTCFNGLSRYNKKGQFNAPIGNYKNPIIYDSLLITSVASTLKGQVIIHGDFELVEPYISAGDFIYFDPPYKPISDTAKFTEYTDKGFPDTEHIRLKNLIDRLTAKDVFCMCSNSAHTDIKTLFQGYKIDTVHVRRNVNSKGTGRSEVPEYIIMNY